MIKEMTSSRSFNTKIKYKNKIESSSSGGLFFIPTGRLRFLSSTEKALTNLK